MLAVAPSSSRRRASDDATPRKPHNNSLRGAVPAWYVSAVLLRISLPTTPDKKAALLAARTFHAETLALPGVTRGPLAGEHSRLDARMYFYVCADEVDAVERAAIQVGAEVERLSAAPKVSECLNCGNVAESESTRCPNCEFQDISPCPNCHWQIPRTTYVSLSGDLHQCPNCHEPVRLVFNDPLWHEDGTYHEPVVLVLPRGS